MKCDIALGQAPTLLSYVSGTVTNEGTLAWQANEELKIDVRKNGETQSVVRKVARVKFEGKWTRGGDNGRTSATMYFDREWSILLKTEGWYDSNLFGEKITLIEQP